MFWERNYLPYNQNKRQRHGRRIFFLFLNDAVGAVSTTLWLLGAKLDMKTRTQDGRMEGGKGLGSDDTAKPLNQPLAFLLYTH